MRREVLIDGGRFCDYDGFVEEFNRAYLAVFGGPPWDGASFSDLDDFLESPGGRPSIRWINSQKSASDLGHEGMAEFWLRSLARCRTAFPKLTFMHQNYQDKIDRAAAGRGETLFGWLVVQLSNENVDLKLE